MKRAACVENVPKYDVNPGPGRRWLEIFGLIFALALAHHAAGGEPRIVNIYNFIRNSDYRVENSEAVLFETTRNEIELLRGSHLPATWALQYDALINPRYQNLLKEQLSADDEIAAWWEIPQPLAQKAGLAWRGRHEWDPAANVGFSSGYTPKQRRKLVDVYMADFKSVFGRYPKTIGSWYIDEVTLAYAAQRYGIVASCNCKDQVGTDGYTLWGGYWNQAYYPSRLNAYMPAQNEAGQIDVPIFRMLGSDPIYQHGTTPGMFTLEPVYAAAGGSERWVTWFMNNLVDQPSLAFGYTQVGQENSFGWKAMRAGLTQQVGLLAAEVQAGKIHVETLAQAGEWFRSHYLLTPPTAVVALDDWKHENRKSLWYDSRFYRLNLLWENNALFIRDLHCFDETMVSPTHAIALTAKSMACETLPIMDWALWSKAESRSVGMWPVLLSPDGTTSLMSPAGPPAINERTSKDLSVEQPLAGGGRFSIICSEARLTFTGVDRQGQPLDWAWCLVGGRGQKSVVRSISPTGIDYRLKDTDYQLRTLPGNGSCKLLENGDIRLLADKSGRLVLLPGTAAARTTIKM